MKKLLSTIGLGIALMTGLAPSQALATITFVNISTGPGTWTYDLTITNQVMHEGDSITLTAPVPVTFNGITAVNNQYGASEAWGLSGVGTNTLTWTLQNASLNPGPDSQTFHNFRAFSTFPNGTDNWAISIGTSGTTQGPVPEPATVMLLGIGGLLAGGRKLYERRNEDVTA
jgi:hypothetical protein